MLQMTHVSSEGNLAKQLLEGADVPTQPTHPDCQSSFFCKCSTLSRHSAYLPSLRGCLPSCHYETPAPMKKISFCFKHLGNLRAYFFKWCSDVECTISMKQGTGTREMSQSGLPQHSPTFWLPCDTTYW